MKVLITGASGQVGAALVSTAPAGHEILAADRQRLDLTQPESVRRLLENWRPAVVINAAAHTAVDQAESMRDLAFSVNGDGAGILAHACRSVGARLVHVSTDFVFDGAQGRPYRPEDPPAPINVYGASKLEGERQIIAVAGLQFLVVRTAWVYSKHGRNFALTMLRLFRERPIVSVVCDQVGTPTSATTLARCLWRAAEDDAASAILHFTDAGVASWYDFAVAIHEEAHRLGLLHRQVDVVPIASAQYSAPARRPSYSVLDVGAALQRWRLTPVHWRTSLREVLKEIGA